jgi:putative cell wall-binding protein
VGALTDSPVLVAPNSLPPETAAALRALQPRDIAVLGGSTAVSDSVLEQLRGFTAGGVNRLSGTSRYETAARVAQTFWPATTKVVYLASGLNFPDALAGVPAAGRDGAPLLLVDPKCMPAVTRAELDRLQPSTIVVLGGPGAVSDAAASGASCAAPPPPPPPSEPPPPPPPSSGPPADKDCGDFSTQREAQAFFDRYYSEYGDFARLDSDGDLIACEGRP